MNAMRKPENICAAALIICFFMPWITIFGFSASGFDLSKLGSYGNWAWVIPISAAITITLSYAGLDAKLAALVTGALPFAGLYYLHSKTTSGLVQLIGKSTDLFQVAGIGLYLSLLVGFLMILFGSGAVNLALPAVATDTSPPPASSDSPPASIAKTGSASPTEIATEGNYRACPMCAEPIRNEAIKCRFCGSTVEPNRPKKLGTSAEHNDVQLPPSPSSSTSSYVAPSNATTDTYATVTPPIFPADVESSALIRQEESNVKNSLLTSPLLAVGTFGALVAVSILAYLMLRSPPPEPPRVAALAKTNEPPPLQRPASPSQSEASSVPAPPAAGALNELWHGKWVSSAGTSIEITPTLFDKCRWIGGSAEIPKRRGCWARYGPTYSGAQLLGLDGKTKLNPKSATLARSINASDNYKTVHTIQTDDKGLEEQFGDCSTLYFYDKQRVIAFGSCQMGTDFETGLEAYSKAT